MDLAIALRGSGPAYWTLGVWTHGLNLVDKALTLALHLAPHFRRRLLVESR